MYDARIWTENTDMLDTVDGKNAELLGVVLEMQE